MKPTEKNAGLLLVRERYREVAGINMGVVRMKYRDRHVRQIIETLAVVEKYLLVASRPQGKRAVDNLRRQVRRAKRNAGRLTVHADLKGRSLPTR